MEYTADEKICDLKAYLDPLNGKEFYFNWVGIAFNHSSAVQRYEKQKCKLKCKHFENCDYCKFNGAWRLDVSPTIFYNSETQDLNKDKGYFNKFVSWNGDIAFLEIYLGEFENALKRLNYLDSNIQENFHPDDNKSDLDYMDGYLYLTNMLKAFIKLTKESLCFEDFAKMQSFNDLSTMAKVAILSVKYNFHKKSRDNLKMQTETLRKLIDLDPINPFWYEKLGVNIRNIKKYTAMKSDEETRMFLKAYDLKPSEPKFLVSFCRSIADILKENSYSTLEDVLTIDSAEHLFSTVQGAINFIKEKTMTLLKSIERLDKTSDTAKLFSTIGEVFSVCLPPQFIDLDLAEKFILTATQVFPTCYQSNYRMGLFQWMKRQKFDLAAHYLKKAVGEKFENFDVLIDYVQLLLHKADDQVNLLAEIFDKILSTDFHWTKDETARLQFLKGCFFFMTDGDENETIKCFVSGYANNNTRLFETAFSAAHRFEWLVSEWNFDTIINFLKKFSTLKVTKRMKAEVFNLKNRQEEDGKQKALRCTIDTCNRVFPSETTLCNHITSHTEKYVKITESQMNEIKAIIASKLLESFNFEKNYKHTMSRKNESQIQQRQFQVHQQGENNLRKKQNNNQANSFKQQSNVTKPVSTQFSLVAANQMQNVRPKTLGSADQPPVILNKMTPGRMGAVNSSYTNSNYSIQFKAANISITRSSTDPIAMNNLIVKSASQNNQVNKTVLGLPSPSPYPNNEPCDPYYNFILPRPIIRINSIGSNIVILWTMDKINDRHAEVASYQIFVYQETAAPSPEIWRHVGDVKAMPLPMAVTLTEFEEGHRYHFAVRAIDKHSRFSLSTQDFIDIF